METALIIALIELGQQMVVAKLAHDQTTAAERAKLIDAMTSGAANCNAAYAAFMAEAAKAAPPNSLPQSMEGAR